uniref:Uncharacterized protein n=1 Tax=Anguilla anguilla TaxID=7936 RepID=A0A0E9W4B5_ANGAN
MASSKLEIPKREQVERFNGLPKYQALLSSYYTLAVNIPTVN